MSTATATKIKRKPFNTEQPLETDKNTAQGVASAATSVGKGVWESFWKDVLKGSVNQSLPDQLLPGEKSPQQGGGKFQGELSAGQEVTLKKQESIELLKRDFHREYFRSVESTEIRAEKNQETIVEKKVEEIRVEIQKLIKASKQMEMAFKDIAKDTQKPVVVGKYHLTFFEWVLSMLKNARAKMEEGASWTKMFASKKRQKQYWNMFKKHGTSFGLSGERTTATQTG